MALTLMMRVSLRSPLRETMQVMINLTKSLERYRKYSLIQHLKSLPKSSRLNIAWSSMPLKKTSYVTPKYLRNTKKRSKGSLWRDSMMRYQTFRWNIFQKSWQIAKTRLTSKLWTFSFHLVTSLNSRKWWCLREPISLQLHPSQRVPRLQH